MKANNESAEPAQIDVADKAKARNLKKSFALILIGILLLGLYPFRWEKGPIQNENGLQIEHKRDRLNGQWWTVFYGKDANGEFISGVEKPYISQEQIKYKEILIKNRPEFKKRINSLNQSIEETNQRIKELSEFHHTFNSITAREFNNWASPPETFDHLLDSLTWTTCVPEDADPRWESGKVPQLPYEKEPEASSFLISVVPKEILDKENAYRHCFTTLANIRTEKNQLEQEINEIAKQELNQYAYNARDVATIVWFSLVAVSFLCGGLFYKKYSKLKNQ